MRHFLRALAVTAALVVLALARPGADESCEFTGVPRIVAVGDVHGAYDAYLAILREAGIVNQRGRWAAGKTHFVQLGDVLDRGPDSRRVVDLLQRLERDASSAGGRVHFLIGNHEAMRMMGDMRYVSEGEYAAFTTRDSADLRDQVIESYPADQRAALLQNTPLGMIELIRAYSPRGQYGTYLRKLNAVVRINGILFLHGGISPAVASMPCVEINATIRRELGDQLQQTMAKPLESLTAREDGPLWYRGLARELEDTFAPELDKILAAQQARAIVVGHTVTPTGRIESRFGGKVFVIDTGLNSVYVKNGRGSALDVQNGTITAVYLDRRDVLAGAPAQEGR